MSDEGVAATRSRYIHPYLLRVPLQIEASSIAVAFLVNMVDRLELETRVEMAHPAQTDTRSTSRCTLWDHAAKMAMAAPLTAFAHSHGGTRALDALAVVRCVCGGGFAPRGSPHVLTQQSLGLWSEVPAWYLGGCVHLLSNVWQHFSQCRCQSWRRGQCHCWDTMTDASLVFPTTASGQRKHHRPRRISSPIKEARTSD